MEYMPKLKDNLKFDLEYDELHRRVRKYLNDTQGEVVYRAQVENEVNKVLNSIPNQAMRILGIIDRTFVYMDVDTCTTKLLNWNNADKKATLAGS
jgi:hypothetical protein